MGAVGSTFGRNLQPHLRPDLFDEPNPVDGQPASCSTASSSIPARSLNLLAAAWIQFQVHDWVNHPRHPLGEDDVVVPLPGRHDVVEHARRRRRERQMRIAGNDAPYADGGRTPPILSSATTTSHWWDGSEVYGADADKADVSCARARSCG